MKAHRTLLPEDLLRYGPAKMARMVASEFGRASTGCQYRSDVVACYDRARELMGVLETVPIDDQTAAYLKPCYKLCVEKELLREERLAPEFVREFSDRMAEAFERAAQMLLKGPAHA